MVLEQRSEHEWWVDLDFGCGLIVTDDKGIIIETMPVLSKFRGQHISSLESWKPYIERKEIDTEGK